jgi:hypothetical protein
MSQQEGSKDIPTIYGLYQYIKSLNIQCCYKTVRRYLEIYCPDNKKDFDEIRADLLSRGAAMGLYNVVACIFALKNWCGWKDKADTVEEADNGILIELSESLKKLEDKKTG